MKIDEKVIISTTPVQPKNYQFRGRKWVRETTIGGLGDFFSGHPLFFPKFMVINDSKMILEENFIMTISEP